MLVFICSINKETGLNSWVRRRSVLQSDRPDSCSTQSLNSRPFHLSQQHYLPHPLPVFADYPLMQSNHCLTHTCAFKHTYTLDSGSRPISFHGQSQQLCHDLERTFGSQRLGKASASSCFCNILFSLNVNVSNTYYSCLTSAPVC